VDGRHRAGPDAVSATLEGTRTHMPKTGLGQVSRVINGYPLYNSEACTMASAGAAPTRGSLS